MNFLSLPIGVERDAVFDSLLDQIMHVVDLLREKEPSPDERAEALQVKQDEAGSILLQLSASLH